MVPEVLLDLPDRLAVQKPAGWEVFSTLAGATPRFSDGVSADARLLSDFFRTLLPERRWPLLADATHRYGFVHRLDVPGSGLILMAKTYEAYFGLQLQLGTGVLVRDYVGLLRGWFPPARSEVHERVYWTQHVTLPSTVSQLGRPSRTYFKVLAHTSLAGEALSLAALRLGTGRRHQIRVHTAHVGHATVCDGRYCASPAFISDRQWCERNFLHRYRLRFLDGLGLSRETSAPLPPDLLAALRRPAPRPGASREALRPWLTVTALGQADWAALGALRPASSD